MTKPTLRKLIIALGHAIGASFGVVLVCSYLLINGYGCTSVKGQDVARHTDYSRGEWTATTQRADTIKTERVASTQVTGGETQVSESGTRVSITPDRVEVQTADRRVGTTQPSVVTIDKRSTDDAVHVDTTAGGKTRASVTDDVKVGPTYSGGNAEVTVNGDRLSSKAIRSKLSERWLFIAIAGLIGLVYWLLPPPKGSVLMAAACWGAAAASLVVSDFWFVAVCAVPVILAIFPQLRVGKLYSRLSAQIDDWKSDMPAGTPEREALDSTLAIAARGNEKFVDRVRVANKHAKVAIPVPAVSEVTA